MLRKVIFLIVALLLGIRLWVFLFYAVFGETKFATDIVNDFFHHYFLGIAIFPLALALRDKLGKFFIYLLSFSLALVIDEYTLILKDLGLNLPYTYTSGIDHLSILIFSGIFLTITKFALTETKAAVQDDKSKRSTSVV